MQAEEELKQNKPRICVVGSTNVDLTFRTSRLPMPGETVAGHSLHQCLGGKGANQAVVAARLGAQVCFISCVGNDDFGNEALKVFESEGIETAYVKRSQSQPTGTAAILVDDVAENSIVVVAGANAELTPDDVRAGTQAIEQAEVLLGQLETPLESVVEAFRIARAVGTKTLLTPAPADFVSDELLELCDVCIPNKTEIAAIVSSESQDASNSLRAAKLLCQRGVGAVVLTLGKEGALLYSPSGVQQVAANSVEAIDSTGAGDAFTGALAVGLAEGLSLEESATRAVVVAGISVTRLGTQTSFPTVEDLNQFSEQPNAADAP